MYLVINCTTLRVVDRMYWKSDADQRATDLELYHEEKHIVIEVKDDDL